MPTLWDGAPASVDQLTFLGAHNYGHFTVFQVRRQAVRGLGLHVQRLQSNAELLFGSAPGEQRVRALLAQAVTEQDCSVRVTVVSRDLDGLLNGAVVEPEIVITTGPARQSSAVPITVRTMSYQRETPSVKHRATHGLIAAMRAARQTGFDDALFVNPQGQISEGSTWNACFRTDDGWVWPEADVLQGVTMQLIQAAMDTAGVAHQRQVVEASGLTQYRAAFALNALSPAQPIARVDGHTFIGDTAAAVQLEELWRGIAPEAL